MKDFPGLDEDELAELISVATKRLETLRWWTFSASILSLCSNVASDKRLDVGSVISTVPFKIVLQKGEKHCRF